KYLIVRCFSLGTRVSYRIEINGNMSIGFTKYTKRLHINNAFKSQTLSVNPIPLAKVTLTG
ncbi:hypothetical protein U5N28_15345, partial [Lysinibacillus telephonicus]|uniref:hypothetical protein n=1 Tax=Lysinibacillus telephonicus TaxID=1714840 RepID=UPI00397CCE88